MPHSNLCALKAPGRRLDGETSLYYYRARMYSATIGRFLQTDPIGYADGINWYAYCGNNPIGLVEPLEILFRRQRNCVVS